MLKYLASPVLQIILSSALFYHPPSIMAPTPDFLGPVQLIRRLRKNAPVRKGLALQYLIRISFSLPAYWVERIFRARKIHNTSLEKPPIFILGHYRSGTTLLHKLLSSHPDWAYIDGKNLLLPYNSKGFHKFSSAVLGRLIALFRIKNPYFHNYRFLLQDPIEEDNFLIFASSPYTSFWGFIFPKQFEDYLHRYIFFHDKKEKAAWQANYLYLLKKISRTNKGRQLVLKNPPNTGRVKVLLELFPDAKFIFIYRNPYAVFSSMEYLLKEVIQKRYSLHKLSPSEREQLIFRHYKVLMDRYEAEKELIPPENLYELRYEQMLAHPEDEIKKLLASLKLEGNEKIEEEIRIRLSKEKSYSPKKYYFSAEQEQRISHEWGSYIRKWQYSPPPINNHHGKNEKPTR
jgi:hypothetical protein